MGDTELQKTSNTLQDNVRKKRLLFERSASSSSLFEENEAVENPSIDILKDAPVDPLFRNKLSSSNDAYIRRRSAEPSKLAMESNQIPSNQPTTGSSPTKEPVQRQLYNRSSSFYTPAANTSTFSNTLYVQQIRDLRNQLKVALEAKERAEEQLKMVGFFVL